MIKCLICGKNFKKVCAHVWQKHNISAREYKESFDLPVKMGIMTEECKKIMSDHTKKNGTIENLKVGEKFRFKKGQEGIGKYHRSAKTLKHLKSLHKTTKVYKNKHPNIPTT